MDINKTFTKTESKINSSENKNKQLTRPLYGLQSAPSLYLTYIKAVNNPSDNLTRNIQQNQNYIDDSITIRPIVVNREPESEPEHK